MMYGGRPYRFGERAGEVPCGESILRQEIFDDDVGNIDDDLSVTKESNSACIHKNSS